MRKLFSILSICAYTGTMAQNIIKIKGSETMNPMMARLAGDFTIHNNKSFIKSEGFGSTLGIIDLRDDKIDIATSSRKMTDDEKKAIEELHGEGALVEVKIAREAMIVIVNRECKVSSLTTSEVKGIFEGTITNWSKLGGVNKPITLFIRPNSSGIYKAFKELAMEKKEYSHSAIMLRTNKEMKTQVGSKIGAIGYLGFSISPSGVIIAAVGSTKEKAVLPNAETIKDGTYPYVRDCYLYYLKKNEVKITTFLNYIKSEGGKRKIEESGFVRLVN